MALWMAHSALGAINQRKISVKITGLCGKETGSAGKLASSAGKQTAALQRPDDSTL
jgi:hypothetical protein